MKVKYLLYVLLLSLLSCDDGIDKTTLEAESSKIQITSNGLVVNTILDMGNDFCDYEIYLNKSGYVDREAKIELKYEADLIDSIFDDKDDIIVLPQSCIILNDELIIMKDAQSFCKTEFKFCINEIKKIQNDNPGKQLLLPVKLYLHNDNNEIVLSEGKDYIIFDLSITEPFAELKNKGSVIPISIDRFRNPGIENVAFPIEINLPFENSKYEFEFSYKVDPLLLDEYNEKFGTSYELLPSGYVLPTLKIEAEEQSCKGNIIINCAEFPLSVGGTEYLLPIVITDSGNELIPMQEGSVCYFLIKFKSKWSGSWKNMVHDGESGVSTTPGTVYDTYLYSRKDALEQIKDYTVVTAFSIIQDEDAILCPGWAGTMFEQCCPIIKVTDKDAGNGKFIIEILAGWAYEGAGWVDPSVANNKSTYDPATNEIYLDYTGVFLWGDFHFQRTFSGQVPFE